jgi:hypothetical protein
MTVEPLLKYQANGMIEGKVKTVGDSFRVQIGSREYKLTMGKQKKGGVRNLIENSVEPLVLKVCPAQDKDKELQFSLYEVITTRPPENTIDRFILRGIWQYLQSSELPVFSIYRNQLRSKNDCYRPKHLAVIWDGQPAHRYGENQAQFSQIIAKLDPLSGNLIFESEIAPPSQPVPFKCFRYVEKPKLKLKTIESDDLVVVDA